MMKRLLTIILLTIGFSTLSRAQIMMLKTNALMDAATVPNLSLEIRTLAAQSINLSAYVGYGILGKEMDVQFLSADYRFYPFGKAMNQLYMGINATAGHYDLTFSREGFMGDAIGGGIDFGWMWKLGRSKSSHWYMEAGMTVGCLYFTHKHRWMQDYQITREYNQEGNMILPYRIGISIAYLINYNDEDRAIAKKEKVERKQARQAKKKQ